MAVRRRRGLGVAALALFALAALSGSAVARAEEDGVSDPDAGPGGAFGADADPIAVDEDDASDDALPASEDVPVHKFETTVVTVGKASGKEKRKEMGAFFLRGDDAVGYQCRDLVGAIPELVQDFVRVFAHLGRRHRERTRRARQRHRLARELHLAQRGRCERLRETQMPHL